MSKYKRKTEQQSWDPQVMQRSINAVKDGMPMQTAAKTSMCQEIVETPGFK